jgi:hypothetical protein
VDRREAVRLLGAIAAVPFLPKTAEAATRLAEQVHGSLQGGPRYRTFDASQQALVARISDAILPRTDTPGALDVRVPEFIDHIVTEWSSDAERSALLAGLGDIEARARAMGATGFTALDATRQASLLRTLDADRRATTGAGHAWGRIKALTVYGYFTSEVVQRDVLKAQVFHEAFQPCAPA